MTTKYHQRKDSSWNKEYQPSNTNSNNKSKNKPTHHFKPNSKSKTYNLYSNSSKKTLLNFHWKYKIKSIYKLNSNTINSITKINNFKKK